MQKNVISLPKFLVLTIRLQKYTFFVSFRNLITFLLIEALMKC